MLILIFVLVFASVVGAEVDTTDGSIIIKKGEDVITLTHCLDGCPIGDGIIAGDGIIVCNQKTWTWALKTTLEMVSSQVTESWFRDMSVYPIYDHCEYGKESIDCIEREIKDLEDKKKARFAADAKQKERERNIKNARMVLDECGIKETP